MNCAEPANTTSDINWPCHRCSGPDATSVPKMTPKGAAPTIIGMMSRAPAVNSFKWPGWVGRLGVGWVNLCLLGSGSIAGGVGRGLYVLAGQGPGARGQRAEGRGQRAEGRGQWA